MYCYAPALAMLYGILAAGVSSAADKVADPYVGSYEGVYTPADGKSEPAIGAIRTSTRNPGEYLILMKLKADQPGPARTWGAVGKIVDGKLEVSGRGVGMPWRGALANGGLAAEYQRKDWKGEILAGKIRLTRRTGQPDAAIQQVPTTPRAATRGPKRILLIAGRDSHPPGLHEYDVYVVLLEKWLTDAKLPESMEIEVYHKEDLGDLSFLDGADTIILGNDYGVSFLQGRPGERERFRALMARGVGFVCIHGGTSIGVDDITRLEYPGWLGGVWIRGFSGLANTKRLKEGLRLPLPLPGHPICRGVEPFSTSEEVYCSLWFASTGKLDPLVQVPLRDGLQTISWAFERPGGGRSFGFTGLHDLKTLEVDGVRKLLLNAILWTAKIDVPPQGVPSTVKPEELLPAKP